MDGDKIPDEQNLPLPRSEFEGFLRQQLLGLRPLQRNTQGARERCCSPDQSSPNRADVSTLLARVCQ